MQMRKSIWLLALLACGMLLATPATRETPVVLAVRKALPSVVSIGTEQVARVRDPYLTRLEEFFSLFQKPTKTVKQYTSLGSGVLLCPTGLVLTNWHVIRVTFGGKILVHLNDGRNLPATLVGYDEVCDLCLIQLEEPVGDALAPISLAKGDDLMLGETVIALGTPFGLENSVSTGVLSALNRNIRSGAEEDFDDILQTDAAINPGNSGGPLLNLDGDLIGINQAIRSDAQGIGFAIPVRRIEAFLSRWMQPENFTDAEPNFAVVESAADGEGARVTPLPGSAAEKAGLKEGDVIVRLNGREVRNSLDFLRIYRLAKPNQRITCQRRGEETSVTFQMEKMSDERVIEARLGLRLQKLTPAMNEALGLPDGLVGLAVTEVLPPVSYKNQNAEWRKALRRGDILLTAGETQLDDVAKLAEILRGSRCGQTISFQAAVQRQRMQAYYQVEFKAILN